GKTPEGAFGLAVEIVASIPNVDAATAKDLVEKAHQVCPYSSATRGNIEVTLTVA
ncbi:organic hydroperoxide resistance protein, partial [Streptomyces noursei]